MEPIYLSEQTSPNVQKLLADDNRLILVTGSTAHHQPYLPLGINNIIPLILAEELSARTAVPIAPVLNIGMSEEQMSFAGTFTFTQDTLQRIYLEMIQSAYRQGWRRLFILNGHLGNKKAWNWAAPLACKIKKELRIHVTHWWLEKFVTDFIHKTMGEAEEGPPLAEIALIMRGRPALLPTKAMGKNMIVSILGQQLLELILKEYQAVIEGDWGSDA
jgi:creatinine amidohydrolase